jgi:serine/threonine protein phosphatase PrpC
MGPVQQMSIDVLLKIEEEKQPGEGEDAAVSWVSRQSAGSQSALIASLDGLGGSGAKRYPNAKNWTGARLSSFSCGRALVNWFHDNQIGELGLQGYALEKIRDSLEQVLHECVEQLAKQPSPIQGSRIVSSMVRSFPTTIAAVLLSTEQGAARVLFLWAGDSRCYLLTKNGLRQMTRDDLKKNIDPFDNLIKDGVMSNVVCEEGFHIHCIEKKIAEPFMVITATDGCFGYLTSPMAFEGLLLETLEESNTPLEWEGKLREAIGAVTGDDYTLQASAVGFCDFAMLKQYYMNAWANFQHLYGSRLRSAGDEEALRSIWNEYKLEYMGE